MLRPPAVPPLTLAQCAERAAGPAAPLKRRLAAFVYEGVLLFGVVMLVGTVFALVTQQRHGLQGRAGLQAVLFLALAVYFIWFWIQGGQTLAMKTWHVRLVGHDGMPLTPAQAAARAVLSWLWFAPPLLLVWAAHWHHGKSIGSLLTLWVVAYAASSFFLPRRQFLHDVLCRTRVIDTRP